MQANALKTSWRNTFMLKCSTCFCWNLFLHNRWMFDSSKKSISTVENMFTTLSLVLFQLPRWWHEVGTEFSLWWNGAHHCCTLSAELNFVRNFVTWEVSSICWFGSCKINCLQIPNVQLIVNLLFWGPVVWDSNRVPLNNPFHTGIQSESKPPIHH